MDEESIIPNRECVLKCTKDKSQTHSLPTNKVNPPRTRNESSLTKMEETQSTSEENESPSTIIEEDQQPLSEDRILIENEFSSTIIEEDSQSSSECQEFTENEYSSMIIEEDPQSTSKDIELIENESDEEDSQTYITSEEMEIEENVSSIIVEEDSQPTSESRGRTEELEEGSQPLEVPPVTIESQIPDVSAAVVTSKSSSPLKKKKNLINDNSTLLLDYQLCIEGKYMCDVIEIPEYIVVLSIPKAKETRPAKHDLGLRKNKEKARSLLDIPPSITITRTISEEQIISNTREYRGDKHAVKPQQLEEIDFVYYMAEDVNPRREREIQVDIETTTKESSVQCDVDLDINMVPLRQQSNPSDLNKRECLVCGEILRNYSAHVKHSALHESDVPSLCPYCGATFGNPQKLIAHEKYFHIESMMQIKKALRCPRLHCQKAFHSKKQLYNHIDEHIRNSGYKCHKCLRVFTSSLKLFSHQRTYRNCSKGRIAKSKMYLTKI